MARREASAGRFYARIGRGRNAARAEHTGHPNARHGDRGASFEPTRLQVDG